MTVNASAAKGAGVSVVIPVLNAAPFLPALFESFVAQGDYAPGEVVLVDSGSSDGTRAVAGRYANARVIGITNFSHGRARNMGVREARGDFIVFMTQDAVPQGNDWISELLAPFRDASVGAVFSRQVPKPDAPPTERFFLEYHFPPGPPIRREKRAGAVLTFPEGVFFSNVSSAVRREVAAGFPFDESLIMSEDQQFARDVIEAGFAVVYQPSSVVMHSHSYTLSTAFRRYFDSVYSLTRIFRGHGVASSAALGMKYLRDEAAFIARTRPSYLPYYVLYAAAKAAGTLCAHCADRLPLFIRKKFSLHRYHWERGGEGGGPA